MEDCCISSRCFHKLYTDINLLYDKSEIKQRKNLHSDALQCFHNKTIRVEFLNYVERNFGDYQYAVYIKTQIV